MAGLIAVPVTPLSVTHTHTHICACVDHLLTMLCNSSTCLGLRLLFPSKESSPCQDWTGLDSCPPVVFVVFFLSPCSLPTSGLKLCIIHLDRGKPLCRCHWECRSHCYCFFYLTANLSFKMNHHRLSLQPFNISLLYLFFCSRLNSTTHCITSVFSLRLLILLFVLHFGTYIWHCIQLHDRILLQWTNIWVVSFLFCTPPEIKYSTAFIQSKNGAQGGLL